jgi:Epoxide hydrolase N terminus
MTEIRSFTANVPDVELVELRRRINATRRPDKETVTDDSQGVPLATMQELARYWETAYVWRKREAKLNALPHFVTAIDGLNVHFIHVRSKHGNALPLVVTHGWPGSIIEQLKIIEPLTDPTEHTVPAQRRRLWPTCGGRHWRLYSRAPPAMDTPLVRVHAMMCSTTSRSTG